MPAVIAPSEGAVELGQLGGELGGGVVDLGEHEVAGGLGGGRGQGGAGLGDAVLGGLQRRERRPRARRGRCCRRRRPGCRGPGRPGRRPPGPARSGPGRGRSRPPGRRRGGAEDGDGGGDVPERSVDRRRRRCWRDSAAVVSDAWAAGRSVAGDRVAGLQQVVTAGAEVGVGASGRSGRTRRPRATRTTASRPGAIGQGAAACGRPQLHSCGVPLRRGAPARGRRRGSARAGRASSPLPFVGWPYP